MNDRESVKPVQLGYQLNKSERAALLATTELLMMMFDLTPDALPEFFRKAASDIAMLLNEAQKKGCTCSGCENRRKAEQAGNN